MNVAYTDIHTDVTVLRNTNEGVTGSGPMEASPHGIPPPSPKIFV